jgi:glycosyltransferase involved in cell wall biosynthesis
MSRVLVLSPEKIRPRMAGMAIRAVAIARTLARAGHDVSLACPGGSEGARGGALAADDSGRPAFARDAAAHDVAVVSGHALETLGDFPGAVVADLYDPFLVENLAYAASLGPRVFENDRRAFFGLAERADLLLAASEEQRLFYAGLLLGRDALHAEDLDGDPDARRFLAVAPFGVDETEPGPPAPAPELGPSPHDVLFGGVYDWYDPALVLDAWADVLAAVPDARLVFCKSPNPDSTPQARLAAAEETARARGWLGRSVRVVAWTPYEERGGFYRSFRAAVLAHAASLETRLSFRTRVLDFLWAGLPVAATEGGAASALVASSGAGLVVRPDPRALSEALIALLGDDALHAKAAAAARRAAAERPWSATLAPLLAFAESPRRRNRVPRPFLSRALARLVP